MERSIKPLALSVPLRVMEGHVGFLDSIKLTQLSDDFTLKMSSSVRVQSLRHPILHEPLLEKDLSCSLRFLITNREPLSELSENIRYH